jgi:polyisoprenyl-phosphate glycosyltransferase
MKLSFIIPVFNGEQTIQKLFEALKAECKNSDQQFEVIFVWDCGPDNSWDKILNIKAEYPTETKAIKLGRNYGQHSAVICGISYSEGDFILTMDEDLQHSPTYIKSLLEKQSENDYDVVYGFYPNPVHSWFRNMASRVLRITLVGTIPGLNKYYSSFRLLKRNTAIEILEQQSDYPFIDGLLARITQKVGYVKLDHGPRLSGVSSYSIMKLMNHSFRILMNYSIYGRAQKDRSKSSHPSFLITEVL